MIDVLHVERPQGAKKPRTYHRKARKEYLAWSKQRKPGYEKIQACLKGQLSYVRRNLKHVEDLANDVGFRQIDVGSIQRSAGHLGAIPSANHLVWERKPFYRGSSGQHKLTVHPSNCPRESEGSCRIRRKTLCQSGRWVCLSGNAPMGRQQ